MNNIRQTLELAQKLHNNIKVFTEIESNDFFEYPFKFSLENEDLTIYSDQAWVQYPLDVINRIEIW